MKKKTCERLPSRLPIREEVCDWEANARSWAAFLKSPVDSLPEAWTAQKLALHVTKSGSVDGLRGALAEGIDPFVWIDQLHSLLISAGKLEQIRTLPLTPNQEGTLKNTDQLVLDSGIDEVLKDIAEALDVPVRAELMDRRVTSPDVRALMRPRSQLDVLKAALDAVRNKASDSDLDPDYQSANVRLFNWIVEHGFVDHLDDFPAITREGDDGAADTIRLKRNTNPQEQPLAPIPVWPPSAREFAELFPENLVLSDKYCTGGLEAACWDALQNKGFCHPGPLFEAASHVELFFPDEPALDDEVKAKLRSEAAVPRSEIAFLSGGEKNVMDRVRNSQSRGLKLIRFILEHVLPSDEGALKIEETACENGETHRYYCAKWIEPLRTRRWVCIEKGRSVPASAESLSALLAGDEEILKRLSEDRPARLFTAIGASPAEILLRSIGRDDPERIALIQSLATISGAAGGDVAKVGALASAIAGDHRLFQFVEEKKERLDRVARNQKLGALVEQRIRDVLNKVPGIKVVRTGTGHDFRLEPPVGEEEDAAEIEVLSGTASCFIEVKAASDDAVRMSVRQVGAAAAGPGRYVLCVVPVGDVEPSEEQVRERVRFVVDIGTQVAHLWDEYQDLQDAMDDVEKTDGDLAMEMTDQGTRFRVGRDVWQAGSSWDDGITHFQKLLGGYD